MLGFVRRFLQKERMKLSLIPLTSVRLIFHCVVFGFNAVRLAVTVKEQSPKKAKTVIYDEEEDDDAPVKPSKKAAANKTKKKPAVDDEDEWDEAMKDQSSESGASEGDDSFVVDQSESSDASSEDELFNSDSEEEVSKRKTKAKASKPPLAPKPRSAPSTATKPTPPASRSLTVTPDVKRKPDRVLIPFEGTGSGVKSTPGNNLSAFKQSNQALVSPRSQSASPFFGGASTPGSAASSSPGTATVTPSPSQLVLPEGVVGRGSHEHNSFPFLLPEQRKDASGVRFGQPDFNPRTVYVPPKFQQEQTPAMAQWWQFKSENMDTVLFFKVGKFYELFHMDADVGFAELDLIYMKGSKAHSGFPEVRFNACVLCRRSTFV
jgi:hypothetical protein